MSDMAPADPPRARLTVALRTRVQTLHTEAERSGIVADILRGRASLVGYALLLGNLLPAYQALERGLEQHRDAAMLRGLANPALYRSAALAADRLALGVPAAPPLAAATRYAERIAAAARGTGDRLIAHAYTRYVGDLSGGQIMRRLLGQSLGLGPEALGFYAFPELGDLEQFKAGYRDAIDHAGRLVADPDAVIEEAAVAFALNIELSSAIQRAASS